MALHNATKRQNNEQTGTSSMPPASEALNVCKNRGDGRRLLATVREEIGESSYLSELQTFGVPHALQFASVPRLPPRNGRPYSTWPGSMA